MSAGTVKQEAEFNLSLVTVYVLEPMGDIRREVRRALKAKGFGEVVEFDTLKALQSATDVLSPDVMIADAGAHVAELAKYVKEIRQGLTNIDPYFAMILMSWQTDMSAIATLAKAGVDDILVKPISVGLIVERVLHLIENRKKFAITSDYIGPDRRSAKRSEGDDSLVDVPNPLALKANGVYDPSEYFEAVSQAKRTIKHKKVESACERIYMLANVIQPSLSILDSDAESDEGRSTKIKVHEMISLTHHVLENAGSKKHNNVGLHAQSLLELLLKFTDPAHDISSADMKLMIPRAQAVYRALFPDLDEGRLQSNIEKRVHNFKKHLS